MGQADHVHEVARTNPLAHKSKRRKQETAKVEANGVARRRHVSKSVDQTDVAALQEKAALGSQNVVIVKDQHALFANTTKAEKVGQRQDHRIEAFQDLRRNQTQHQNQRWKSLQRCQRGCFSLRRALLDGRKDCEAQGRPPSSWWRIRGKCSVQCTPAAVQTDQSQMPVQEISADASGLAAQPSYPSSLHTNIKVPSEAGVGAQAPQASL
ncbi:hypothetical protein BKA81DRAFT_376518 [Phyllosticta paracitricarpa]